MKVDEFLLLKHPLKYPKRLKLSFDISVELSKEGDFNKIVEILKTTMNKSSKSCLSWILKKKKKKHKIHKWHRKNYGTLLQL